MLESIDSGINTKPSVQNTARMSIMNLPSRIREKVPINMILNDANEMATTVAVAKEILA